ncbi:MAG: SURF1 family protein [Undibacterium sp.]|nr:SURF1 family protein [Undibacterium sp.]
MLKSFILRLIPFLITALLAVLGVVLGDWQTRRAQEKDGLALQIHEQMQKPAISLNEAGAEVNLQSFQRVKITGQFVTDWPLYLDNRPLFGVAGFYLLMPFKMEGSEQSILVERGWLQRNPYERTKFPALMTATGTIVLEGVLRKGVDKSMQLGKSEALIPHAIIQNLSLEELTQKTGLKFYPYVVEQTSDSGDSLVRNWPQPSAGADKHRAYAFQWYGLALMSAMFFLITGIRRLTARTKLIRLKNESKHESKHEQE